MLRSLLTLATLLALGCAAPAPAPPPAPPPETTTPAPPPRATLGQCTTDTDCPGGKVCEGCGGPKECVPGCHQASQCPGGGKCHQVQCIRCPCPGQCEG
ncbi:MAG TPA: hypothetical protein VFA20_12785 [Myxococcaceae bacterium]|nr:hypothetical protein [Myxococcaceae bacterium]